MGSGKGKGKGGGMIEGIWEHTLPCGAVVRLQRARRGGWALAVGAEHVSVGEKYHRGLLDGVRRETEQEPIELFCRKSVEVIAEEKGLVEPQVAVYVVDGVNDKPGLRGLAEWILAVMTEEGE